MDEEYANQCNTGKMGKVITDYFSGSFCINLDDRPQRMIQAQAEFDRLGLEVIRMQAMKGNPHGAVSKLLPNEIGCKQSHMNCIVAAARREWESVLIFEDDVVFAGNANKLFAQYMADMPDDWAMIYLGGNHWGWNLGERDKPQLERVAENVYRTRNTLTTHAYAIRWMVWGYALEEMMRHDVAVDVVYGYIQKEYPCYAIRPNLAWQRDGWSDINNKKCNYYFIREW